MPGVNNKDDFINLVRRLKEETGGVPVGLKIAATHHLEKELQIGLEAEVDFVTLDGAEGGTHGGFTYPPRRCGLAYIICRYQRCTISGTKTPVKM